MVISFGRNFGLMDDFRGIIWVGKGWANPIFTFMILPKRNFRLCDVLYRVICSGHMTSEEW